MQNKKLFILLPQPNGARKCKPLAVNSPSKIYKITPDLKDQRNWKFVVQGVVILTKTYWLLTFRWLQQRSSSESIYLVYWVHKVLCIIAAEHVISMMWWFLCFLVLAWVSIVGRPGYILAWVHCTLVTANFGKISIIYVID